MRTRTGSGSAAVVAPQRSANVDGHRCAEHCLGERDIGDDLQVLATRRARRTTSTAPERAASPTTEERVEQIAEPATGEHVAEVRTTGGRTNAGLPETVVTGSRVGVAEHLVGLGDLLETLLGDRVTRVGVGVQLARLLAIRLLDLVGSCGSRDTEQLVVIGHYAVPSPSRLARRSLTTSTVASACG